MSAPGYEPGWYIRGDKVAKVQAALAANNQSVALQELNAEIHRLNNAIDHAIEIAIDSLYRFPGEPAKVRRALRYLARKDHR
jgi:hypothetical protein